MKFLARFSAPLALLNLAAMLCFWYRYASPILSSTAGFLSPADFLAAQANHNALLQIHLVVFSIFLAVCAFFGYNEIKKTAEKIAEDRITTALNDLVPKLVKEQIEKLDPEQMLVALQMAKSPQPKDVLDEVRVEEVLNGLED